MNGHRRLGVLGAAVAAAGLLAAPVARGLDPVPVPVATTVPTVPSLPLPPLPAPTVPAPTVPAPTVPAPTAVPLPPPPDPSVASAPALLTSTAQAIVAPSPSAPAASGGAPAPAAATASAPRPAATTAPAGTVASGGSALAAVASFAPAQRRRDASRRDARLRRLVLRLHGCLSALPPGDRRVLALRAGLGIGHPRSRRAVGAIMRISTRRVRRIERRAVRELRAVARSSGCAARRPAPTSFGASLQAAIAAVGAAAPTVPSAAPSQRVLGERASGRRRLRPSVAQAPEQYAGPPPLLGVRRGHGGGTDLSLPLAALAALAFVAILARERRRR